MPKHDQDELISLNKYISSTGFCSRRDADKLIEQARVTVNGKLMIESVKIATTDRVEIDGEKLKQKKQALYIAFNKPKGVTSTTDPKDKTNIIYFLNYPKRIFPIGRLDKDSEGLIFLTNDGDIVNKILRASNNHEKEYVVMVDKPITPDFIRQMSNGVNILDTVTKKCKVTQESNKRFRIVLTQGLNRQIRRMCAALDYKVVMLTRVRIMNITLSNIAVGKWRHFTPAEMETMNKLITSSSKTEEASQYEEQQLVAKKRRDPNSIVTKKKQQKPASEKEKDTDDSKKRKPTSYKDFRKRKK